MRIDFPNKQQSSTRLSHDTLSRCGNHQGPVIYNTFLSWLVRSKEYNHGSKANRPFIWLTNTGADLRQRLTFNNAINSLYNNSWAVYLHYRSDHGSPQGPIFSSSKHCLSLYNFSLILFWHPLTKWPLTLLPSLWTVSIKFSKPLSHISYPRNFKCFSYPKHRCPFDSHFPYNLSHPVGKTNILNGYVHIDIHSL